jgi:hypothetical protein
VPGRRSFADWTIAISATRNPEDLYELMSRVEAELIAEVSITGHEIGPSTFSIFIQTNKRTAVKVIRGLEERYLLPGESVTLWRDQPTEPKAIGGGRGFEVFDVFAIPLPSDRFGYAQFLGHIDEMEADAIRVFDPVTPASIADVKDCVGQSERFPPVLTLLKIAVKSFGWKRIGRVPMEGHSLQFRQSNAAAVSGAGVLQDWRIWTTTSGWSDVGDLPEGCRTIEMAVTWSPWAIADRIITGRNLYDACF